MPGMDGRECWRELRRCDPSVKVLLSSGYNEQDVVSSFAMALPDRERSRAGDVPVMS